MQHIKSGWKSWLMLPLACMAIFILGGISPAQAEQTGGLTPAGELLMGLLGGTVGSSSSYAPIKLQADCSADLGKCWEVRGLNKDNEEQVMDTCWKEAKKCPKVCKDRYFAQRKAGMKAARADDTVLFGEPSCIPGLDKRVHSVPKKPNNSTLQVSVTVGGKAADAMVEVIPLDDRGRDVKRTTDGFITANGLRYSIEAAPRPSPGPTIMSLPAGQYRLRVWSPDRNYHPNQKFMPYQAFPEQTKVITVKAGQTLEKSYRFGMGRLVVKARNGSGSQIAATLELRRWDRPNYVLYRKTLPLDTSLISGKYRLVVREAKTRKSKAFNIEIMDGKSIGQTILFDTGSVH